ncbi:DUF4123 domain-containing protein [Vibrio quintilis]|uniref:DUF4123 domain-containing protein n=1 Tax=Vibrio quintilis TaxID=1117707 RepID=A0A1M7YSI3_9VIBR|nr:DUF4123 domain-containing protein [Vibrio quintilis]SHO55573.1 hypothetical protein VQ7734_01309 [Vibrio quintilis]
MSEAFNLWLAEPGASRYWLTGYLAFEQSQQHAATHETLQAALADADVLFSDQTFEQVMNMSPRLMRAETACQLPAEILTQGIGLESQTDYPAMLAHLQSLLMAALDGEEVLFRFYDPQVILPMLVTMSPGEVDLLLGNLNGITGWHEQQLVSYTRSHTTDFALRTETWWKIQPHHLKPVYKPEVHARSLERYWWEKIPATMNIPDDPYAMILQALERAQQLNYSDTQAELLALSTLAQATQTPADSLAEVFHFTAEERNTLYRINKENQA